MHQQGQKLLGKAAHVTCLLAVVKTCGHLFSKHFAFTQTTLFSAGIMKLRVNSSLLSPAIIK